MSPRSENVSVQPSGPAGSSDEQGSAAAKPAASLIDDAVFRPLRSGNSLEDTVARLMQTIRLGVVAPGAFADLLAVDGNPLEDLHLLQDDGAHLALIVKDGVVVKNNLSS